MRTRDPRQTMIPDDVSPPTEARIEELEEKLRQMQENNRRLADDYEAVTSGHSNRETPSGLYILFLIFLVPLRAWAFLDPRLNDKEIQFTCNVFFTGILFICIDKWIERETKTMSLAFVLKVLLVIGALMLPMYFFGDRISSARHLSPMKTWVIAIASVAGLVIAQSPCSLWIMDGLTALLTHPIKTMKALIGRGDTF